MNYQAPPPRSYKTFDEPAPPKKSRAWMWIVGCFLLLLGALGFLAINLGQKFGKQMNEGLEFVKTHEDSIQQAEIDVRNSLYEQIFSVHTTDSSYLDLQEKVKHLRKNSDAIREMYRTECVSFAESLPDTTTFTMFSTEISKKYFITSGKAFVIKNLVVEYERRSREDCPSYFIIDTTSEFGLYKPLHRKAPEPFTELLQWENRNFNQPPTAVISNFRMLRKDIDHFEKLLLKQYAHIPIPDPEIVDSASGI